MFSVYIKCPHCNQDTEVTFDVIDIGSFEGYENECDQCYRGFTFFIQTRVQDF